MIRELVYEDLQTASQVLWKSFYEAEKNNHTMTGMELFRDLTDPVSLSINTFQGDVVLYGFFDNDEMLAVGGLKEKKHILMLYVLPLAQGKGVGKELLAFMESICEGDQITLNSSDFAIPFYQHHGFAICGDRNENDGLISTPMVKNISI